MNRCEWVFIDLHERIFRNRRRTTKRALTQGSHTTGGRSL